MKKLLIAIFAIALAVVCTEAQVPNTFNYQAIARDVDGNTMVNHEIALQISLLQGRNGPVVFDESHRIKTNDFGLINVAIGRGEVRIGELSAIDWSSGNYYMEVRMDTKGNGVFELLGTSELFSVPYALYAKNAGGDSRQPDFDWFVTGNDVCTGHGGSYPSGNVGIGTTTPVGKLHIYGAGVGGVPMLGIEHTSGFTTIFRRVLNGPGNALFLMQKARGTLGAETTVQAGDKLGQLRMEGYDGASYVPAGNIIVYVDGTVSPGVVPGGLRFQTADATGTLIERMRVTSTGNVGIGTITPAYNLDVTGNVNATSYYKGGTLLNEGQWTVSGSDIYYISGDVWIGSTHYSPSALSVSESSGTLYSTAIMGGNEYTGTSEVRGILGTIKSTGSLGAGVSGISSGTTGGGAGLYGKSLGDQGKGAFVEATHTTGVNYGIHATTASPNGYAGYFVGGKNYFQGIVGIGTTTPGYVLDVNGPVNATNFYKGGTLFKEGQWLVSGSDIYYNTGNVGIGATPFASDRLHIHTNNSSVSSAGINSVHGYTGTNSVFGVVGKISNTASGIGMSGAGVAGSATGLTGNSSGVSGWVAADQGIGVHSLAAHATGVNYGVYAQTLSPNGYAGYFVGGKNYFAGNVGIGTTSPAYALDVNGIVNANNFYKGGTLFKEGQWTVNGSDIYFTTGNVGIGESTPSHRLHIGINSSTSTPQIRVRNSNVSGDASMVLDNPTESYTTGIDASDNNNFEIANLSNLTGNNTYQDGYTRFRIHNPAGSHGIIDMPGQSRGRAYLSGAQYFSSPAPYPPTPPGWLPIDFDAASYDQHSEWTFLDASGPPTSYFTATEEGYYQVNARAEFDLQEFEQEEYPFPPGTYVSIAIFVNQSIYAQGNNLQIVQIAYPYGPGESITFVLPYNNAPNVSDVVYLVAGDLVEICVTVSNPHTGGSSVLILAGPYVTYASIHKVS